MHHDGTWENRSTYTYYTELVLELAALSVEFLHHVHMLVSGGGGGGGELVSVGELPGYRYRRSRRVIVYTILSI